MDVREMLAGALLVALAIGAGLPGAAFAQSEEGASAASAEAQANNPLADIRAFNVQNYYIPELSGDIDTTANT